MEQITHADNEAKLKILLLYLLEKKEALKLNISIERHLVACLMLNR